jgi:hypothetical protein
MGEQTRVSDGKGNFFFVAESEMAAWIAAHPGATAEGGGEIQVNQSIQEETGRRRGRPPRIVAGGELANQPAVEADAGKRQGTPIDPVEENKKIGD